MHIKRSRWFNGGSLLTVTPGDPPADGDGAQLSGGPGQEPTGGGGDPPRQQQQQAPQLVEVTYGGKTFKVSQDVATTLNQASADVAASKAAAAAARQPPQQPPQQPPKKSAIPTDLMWSDPERYQELIIEEANRRAQEAMTVAYNKDQFVRTFWSEFNRQNPDLADDRIIADALYSKHFSQWTREGLTGEQALAKLAEMTRGEVTRIATKGGKARKDAKPRSEGPSDGASRSAPKNEGEGGSEGEAQPYSTKSILAARKAARETLARGDTKH